MVSQTTVGATPTDEKKYKPESERYWARRRDCEIDRREKARDRDRVWSNGL